MKKYWAKIDKNYLVLEVIVQNDSISDEARKEELVALFGDDWILTDKQTRGGVHYDPETGEPSADQSKALRKNYAGTGFTYDEARDAFIPPKPDPTEEVFEWVLNEETCLWEPVSEA